MVGAGAGKAELDPAGSAAAQEATAVRTGVSSSTVSLGVRQCGQIARPPSVTRPVMNPVHPLSQGIHPQRTHFAIPGIA